MTLSLPRLPLKRLAVPLALAAVALLALALMPELALAENTPGFGEGGSPAGGSPAGGADAAEAGENLGELIRGLAGPVAFSIAGFTGIAAIFRRDLSTAFVLIVVTAVIGLFVTEPGGDALHGLTQTLADALGGS